MSLEPSVGETFLLGFRGTTVPAWLHDFARQHGLGGVILFDYDVPTARRGRNIESPRQLETLCREVHALPSRPLVFIDQEGGQVRRLKEPLGFAPLPSARSFAALSLAERREVARTSVEEMRRLGIDFDLAPVIDLDTNPQNPNIGAIKRSYSPDIEGVRANAHLFGEAARDAGLQLCVKHYPGLGGATVDSHQELTELDGRFNAAQEALFSELARDLPGEAILLSHGLVREWDAEWPVSISQPAIARLRAAAPDALLVTDDLQMEGLRRVAPLDDACLRGLRAGVDLLCVGNNLAYDEAAVWSAVESVSRACQADAFRARIGEASARVQARKRDASP
jgi:beta-N-acetylhexosaminidase